MARFVSCLCVYSQELICTVYVYIYTVHIITPHTLNQPYCFKALAWKMFMQQSCWWCVDDMVFGSIKANLPFEARFSGANRFKTLTHEINWAYPGIQLAEALHKCLLFCNKQRNRSTCNLGHSSRGEIASLRLTCTRTCALQKPYSQCHGNKGHGNHEVLAMRKPLSVFRNVDKKNVQALQTYLLSWSLSTYSRLLQCDSRKQPKHMC